MRSGFVFALMVAGVVAAGSQPASAQSNSSNFGMGPVSGAGGAAGGGPGGAAPTISSSPAGSGAASTGSTMFPGSPLPSRSLNLTVQPSATAGASAAGGAGSTLGVGGATVAGEIPSPGSTALSPAGSSGVGATLDAGANPGLYGVTPGSTGGNSGGRS